MYCDIINYTLIGTFHKKNAPVCAFSEYCENYRKIDYHLYYLAPGLHCVVSRPD